MVRGPSTVWTGTYQLFVVRNNGSHIWSKPLGLSLDSLELSKKHLNVGPVVHKPQTQDHL